MKPAPRPELAEDFQAGELRTSTIDRDWQTNRHNCRSVFQEPEQYGAWRKYEAQKAGLKIVDDGKVCSSRTEARTSSACPGKKASGNGTNGRASGDDTPAAPATEPCGNRTSEDITSSGLAITAAIGSGTAPDASGSVIVLYAADGDQSQVLAEVRSGYYPRQKILGRTQRPVARTEIEAELERVAMLKDIQWSCHSELAPVRSMKRHQELIASDSQ